MLLKIKLPKAKTVAKVGAGVAVAGTGYLIHNIIIVKLVVAVLQHLSKYC